MSGVGLRMPRMDLKVSQRRHSIGLGYGYCVGGTHRFASKGCGTRKVQMREARPSPCSRDDAQTEVYGYEERIKMKLHQRLMRVGVVLCFVAHRPLGRKSRRLRSRSTAPT